MAQWIAGTNLCKRGQIINISGLSCFFFQLFQLRSVRPALKAEGKVLFFFIPLSSR